MSNRAKQDPGILLRRYKKDFWRREWYEILTPPYQIKAQEQQTSNADAALHISISASQCPWAGNSVSLAKRQKGALRGLELHSLPSASERANNHQPSFAKHPSPLFYASPQRYCSPEYPLVTKVSLFGHVYIISLRQPRMLWKACSFPSHLFPRSLNTPRYWFSFPQPRHELSQWLNPTSFPRTMHCFQRKRLTWWSMDEDDIRQSRFVRSTIQEAALAIPETRSLSRSLANRN